MVLISINDTFSGSDAMLRERTTTLSSQ